MKVHFSLAVLALVPLIAAQTCNLECPPKWMTDATKQVNSTPSLVDFFPRDRETFVTVKAATDFFDSIGKRLQKGDEDLHIPRVCANEWNDDSVSGVNNLATYRGLGCIEMCLWKVHHASAVESERQGEAKRMFDVAMAFFDTTIAAGKRLNDKTELGFKYVTSPQYMRESSETNKCEMVKIAANRVNDQWTLRSTLYDLDDPYDSEEPGKTIYTQLIYPEDPSTLKYYPFNFTYCSRPEDKTSQYFEQSNAFLASWENKPSWSEWQTRNTSDNPAIRAGLKDQEISAAVFSEIDTPSDIAIFLLPLLLSLIPATIFNKVRNLRKLLVYIVVDIVAAVPIALKSIEFLEDSRMDKYFAESFFYGSQNYTGAAAAEVFIAKCGYKNKFRNLGLGMLITAVILTVVSITLDIYFYRFFQKRRAAQVE